MRNMHLIAACAVLLAVGVADANMTGRRICGIAPDENILFAWQEGSRWQACGPTQCTSAPRRTEKQAIDYVHNQRDHGKPTGCVCEVVVKRPGKPNAAARLYGFDKSGKRGTNWRSRIVSAKGGSCG